MKKYKGKIYKSKIILDNNTKYISYIGARESGKILSEKIYREQQHGKKEKTD